MKVMTQLPMKVKLIKINTLKLKCVREYLEKLEPELRPDYAINFTKLQIHLEQNGFSTTRNSGEHDVELWAILFYFATTPQKHPLLGFIRTAESGGDFIGFVRQ